VPSTDGLILLVRAEAAKLHASDLFSAMLKYRRLSPRGLTLREAELFAAQQRAARVWAARVRGRDRRPFN
jgi:hypothetical protein